VTAGGGTAPPGGPRRGPGPPDPGPEDARSEQPISLADIWRSEALIDALAARRRIPADARRDPVAELLAAFTEDVDEPAPPQPAAEPLAAFGRKSVASGSITAALPPPTGSGHGHRGLRARRDRQGRLSRQGRPSSQGRPGRQVPVRALATGLAAVMALTGLAFLAARPSQARSALSAALSPAGPGAGPSGPTGPFTVRGMPTLPRPGAGPAAVAPGARPEPGLIPPAHAAAGRMSAAGSHPPAANGTQNGHPPDQSSLRSAGTRRGPAAGNAGNARNAENTGRTGPMVPSHHAALRPSVPATHPAARSGRPTSPGRSSATGQHSPGQPTAGQPTARQPTGGLTPARTTPNRPAPAAAGPARPAAAQPGGPQHGTSQPAPACTRSRRHPGQPWQFWLRGSGKAAPPGGSGQAAPARG